MHLLIITGKHLVTGLPGVGVGNVDFHSKWQCIWQFVFFLFRRKKRLVRVGNWQPLLYCVTPAFIIIHLLYRRLYASTHAYLPRVPSYCVFLVSVCLPVFKCQFQFNVLLIISALMHIYLSWIWQSLVRFHPSSPQPSVLHVTKVEKNWEVLHELKAGAPDVFE